MFRISAFPAEIRKEAGTEAKSEYCFNTSTALISVISCVVKAFTAIEIDSARDTESSGLNRVLSGEYEIKSKYSDF